MRINDSGDRQIPALLHFKPEQLRTGCHATPFILYIDTNYLNLMVDGR